MSHQSVVYRSDSVVVRDVHCALYHERPGPEEHAEDHNIVLVRSGLFTRTTGDETRVADSNQILFFNRREPYRVAHPVAGGDRCTSISLRDTDVAEIVGSYAPADAEREDAPFAFAWTLTTPRMALLHHGLLVTLRRGALAPLDAEDLIFELIDEIIGRAYAMFAGDEHRVRSGVTPRHRALVEAAKLAIGRNIDEPPTLGAMARSLGCSPFHLSRTFHSAAGLPLRRYLDRCRLRTALERLADGERDLTGLALDLGYADHSHFTNSFRREFGMPPSQLRARGAVELLRTTRKNFQA